MSNVESKDSRKVSDILLSLEEKINLLIKTVAANDMNNKLILDRLNKLSSQSNMPSVAIDSKVVATTSNKITDSPTAIATVLPAKISQEPVKTKKNIIPVGKIEKNDKVEFTDHVSVSKIPVGQRVTDGSGKDLFMADVEITNDSTGDTLKVKTNAMGKWQSYLPVGTYSVHISKIIDSNTLQKLESLQTIEILPHMKALQLPIIIIKR